jgi:hypothetical protein
MVVVAHHGWWWAEGKISILKEGRAERIFSEGARRGHGMDGPSYVCI